MAQVGMVDGNKLIETMDEFLSADNATQTEQAMELLARAYAMRANVYRDNTAEQLQMDEASRRDYVLYFETCYTAAHRALAEIRKIGEKLVMAA